MSQLPDGWEVRRDKEGKVYFVNHQTKHTQWADPRPLPAGWTSVRLRVVARRSSLTRSCHAKKDDKLNRMFFVNHATKTTTWTDPRPSLDALLEESDWFVAAGILEGICDLKKLEEMHKATNGRLLNAVHARSEGTALGIASHEGFAAIVAALLRFGADPNLRANSATATTPVYDASLKGHASVVRLLLDAGAKVNIACGKNGSAVNAAARNGHAAIVRMLLEAGADATLRGAGGNTAAGHASAGQHADVLAVLKEFAGKKPLAAGGTLSLLS